MTEQKLLYTVSVGIRRAVLLLAMCLAIAWVPGPWWNLLTGLAAAIAVEMLPPYERQLALWICTPQVLARFAAAPPEAKREVSRAE